MKKVVLFALIAALCAGVLLYFYLGKLESQKQVKIEYDTVIVAAVDIPAYTPITSEMLTIKQIPQGYAHPLAARTLEEAVGFVTERDIVAGEELLPSRRIDYDYLVIAIGSIANDFNIPGVREHCVFLDNTEQASVPGCI